MRRFNNNGKGVCGPSRADTFANGSSRRLQMGGRRDQGGFQRPNVEDSDFDRQFEDDSHTDEPVNLKLDRLLDRFDKWDAWRDETDRRFENLEPYLARDAEPPWGFEDGGVLEDDGNRRRYSVETRPRAGNFTSGIRERGLDNHGRRVQGGRTGFGWDQSGGYTLRGERTTSCWDPPQRFRAAGSDNQERVKMQPPRFDGTDAMTWISRAQYYFDHRSIPDAQRLHYAIMLFDQPAADWVFNYFANSDFVTWQDFLEDVRDRFDRQGPKPVMKERLRLHRPLSVAAAMARARELADTHVDLTLQPPTSTTSRCPWQNREGRGQEGSTPAQQSSQPLPTPIQTQGGPGRAVDEASPPRVRVSQAEKAERARLGLCYYCPDKWSVGHVCKQRLLCYAEDDEGNDDASEGNEGVSTYDENVPNNAAHNGGSNLDVPNDEAIEEIDKTDNMPLQGLVGVYDEKIEEVKKAVVARVTSQDVIKNCLGKNEDWHDSDVARMIHRPTLLAIDARMIPPQNYTACLGIQGCVDKLRVLALNFDDCFDPTLRIFDGKGEVTRPTVRWAFDPGGDTSSKLLRSTLCCFVVSTLRTRWILTGGELIRSSSSLDLLGI